jgi:twitching motility two-component system response regulator PilH
MKTETATMPIRNILIVDDSPTERYFLNELLSKRGFTVTAVESAEEAMTNLQTQLARPHP